MAKRTKKSIQSISPILIGLLIIVVLLFGYVVFKNNQENSDVKGEQIIATRSSTIPIIKRDGNAGEACGRSINRVCKKELICAPLESPYKILNSTPAESELAAESQKVTEAERKCIGKSEDQVKGGCLLYIPYYGACVKKGVWPPPPQKPTPTPGQNECSPCRDGDVCRQGLVCKLTEVTRGGGCNDGLCSEPGVELRCVKSDGSSRCVPTPASCQWCNEECIPVSASINKIVGIQTTKCCPCPKIIELPLIGKDGWVAYEKGKNYSSFLPTECKNVACKPCENVYEPNQKCESVSPPEGYSCMNQNGSCVRVVSDQH